MTKGAPGTIKGIPFTINFTDPTLPGKTKFQILPNTSDGPIYPTSDVPDTSATEIHTSLVLPGMGLVQYGQRINEDLVHLLENFAGTEPPTAPTIGQIWYDYTHQLTKVWNGNSWMAVGGDGSVASVYEYNTLVTLINSVIGDSTGPGYMAAGYVVDSYCL